MTREEFDFFLLCSSGLCLLMAIVNLLRHKARGSSAYFMAAAFVAVGGALMLYRARAETWAVGIVGAIAFVCLVADFAVRARDQVPPGGKA